jgi:hypothetical protein
MQRPETLHRISTAHASAPDVAIGVGKLRAKGQDHVHNLSFAIAKTCRKAPQLRN